MDTELKSKWIAALRSGEFEQGDSQLHNPKTDAYCCLGVLCKAIGAEFGPAVDESTDLEFGPSSYDYVPHVGEKVLSAGEDEELKDSFCEEVGITDQSVLIQMNDGNIQLGIRQHSFAEIADYIEKNL